MAREFKENENSNISFLKKTDEFTDELGRHVVRGKWQLAVDPIDLGSNKNPNKDILQIKIEVEREKPKNPFSSFLDDLLGGGKK